MGLRSVESVRPLLKLGGQLLAGVVLLLAGTQVQLFQQQWLIWLVTLVWVLVILLLVVGVGGGAYVLVSKQRTGAALQAERAQA